MRIYLANNAVNGLMDLGYVLAGKCPMFEDANICRKCRALRKKGTINRRGSDEGGWIERRGKGGKGGGSGGKPGAGGAKAKDGKNDISKDNHPECLGW